MGERTVIDLEQLHSLRELNEPGEPDLVTELIEIFFHQSPITIQAIEEAVTSSDSSKVEKMAHKLKGSCANLGAEYMRSLCHQMEKKGADDDKEGLAELLEEIKQAYKEVSAVLEADWRMD